MAAETGVARLAMAAEDSAFAAKSGPKEKIYLVIRLKGIS
jgi:hypothetical protein